MLFLPVLRTSWLAWRGGPGDLGPGLVGGAAFLRPQPQPETGQRWQASVAPVPSPWKLEFIWAGLEPQAFLGAWECVCGGGRPGGGKGHRRHLGAPRLADRGLPARDPRQTGLGQAEPLCALKSWETGSKAKPGVQARWQGAETRRLQLCASPWACQGVNLESPVRE